MPGLSGGPDAGDPQVADPAATPLARLLAVAPRVPAPARAELSSLRSALADCAGPDAEAPPPAAQVARLRKWLDPVVGRVYDAGAARVADLAHLEQVAGPAPSRSRFVADLTLDPPASTSDLAGPPHLDEDWLVLSTIHSAKGGEWEVVHVLHASDGMFPSDMATGHLEGIDEERRLLYVAVTRARQVLEVNAPVRYHFSRQPHTDAHSYAQISRFLTPAVRGLMDEVHVEGRPPVDDGVDPSAAEPVAGAGLASVDQFLAGLWS